MCSALSTIIQRLPASDTIQLSQYVQHLQQQGKPILNLTLGEPSMPTPQLLQQAAHEAIQTGNYFSYPPVAGYADLREAIAHKLKKENNLSFIPDQIVVTNGAKQALFNVLTCLLEPGDEAIVYTPYWTSYAGMIAFTGAKMIPLQGTSAHHFIPTIEELASAITPQTKVILFSTPANPTGTVLNPTYINQLASLLEQHPKIFVISDEIYEYIRIQEGHHVSVGTHPTLKHRTITINGFSKGFAMTGWRVGYLAAPHWLAQACSKLQGQSTSGCNGIAQRTALAALQASRSILDPMCKAYQKNCQYLLQALQGFPKLKAFAPVGGFFLWIDVKAYLNCKANNITIQSSQHFCTYLLEDAGIALVPGEAFGTSGYVRLSFAAAPEVVAQVPALLKASLSKLT